MYRRYLEQLKLMEADKEQALKDADTEEKDDPPKKAKPTKKKKPEGDPVTPYKSKPGTLVPPTLTPPSAAILGDYSTADVLASQTFRLYVGGLSTDDEAEHRALSEVLSTVRRYCQMRDYDFQAVNAGAFDLHYDVTSDVCLRELRTSQNVSAGVNFLLFLTGSEEQALLPKRIVSEQFHKLCDAKSTSSQEKALMKKWYRCDENFLTPTHVLLPIIDGDYSDTVLLERKSVSMVIKKAATAALSTQEAQELLPATLDLEIKTGILNVENAQENCVCLRKIETAAKKKEEKELLKSRESLIKEKIGTIHHYSVKDRHSEDQLTSIVQQQLCKSIDLSIANRSQRFPCVDDELHAECLLHLQICREKLKGFIDRPYLLKSLKEYILGESTSPLIVYGPRGGGKSTVLAAAVKDAFDWIGKEGGVIIRFLENLPSSFNETSLISSIHGQLYRFMDVPIDKPREGVLKSRDSFHDALKEINGDLYGRRIVIFLDCIERVYKDGNILSILSWFPKKLHQNVKVVLSTSVDENPAFVSQMKESVGENSLLFVSGMDTSQSVCAIHDWLRESNRKITEEQSEKLRNSILDKECTPLVLRTMASHVCLWTSYEDDDNLCLENSLTELFNSNLDRLEKIHGTKFVSRSLAYVTAAKNGLTESDLIDALTFDTEVKSVLTERKDHLHHQNLILSLSRLTEDARYLIQRKVVNGKHMVEWSHPLYKDMAGDRYLSTLSNVKEIHKTLASLFSETSCIKHNAVKQDDKESEEVIDKRKFDALPYHYIRAGMLNEVKSKCLLNADYLYNRLKWTDALSLIEDYHQARLHFPDDEYLRRMRNNMTQLYETLGQPEQLASQFLERLSEEEFARGMLDTIRTWRSPRLEVSPPVLRMSGNHLINSILVGEENEQLSVCRVEGIGDLALIGSETSDSVTLLNINDGNVIREMYLEKRDCEESTKPIMTFAHKGTLMLVFADNTTYAFDVQGQVKYKLSHGNSSAIGFCGNDHDKIIAVSKEATKVYSSSDGSELFTIPGSEICWPSTYLEYEIGHHSENIMIILESRAFALFNIDERSYSKSVEFATDIDGIAISKDETIIVLCNTLKYEEKGETFCVYDVKTLERIKEFKATVPFNKTLTISHDSKFVFYASYPNQIASLNLETGQTGILHTDSDIITDFRHLADDTWVSVSENRLKIWKEDKTAYSVPYEWNKDNLPPISDIYPMENPRYVVFIRKDEEDEDDQGVNGMQNHISEKNNEELIEGKCYAFVIQVYDISSKKVVRQLAQIQKTPKSLGKEYLDDDDFEDLDLQGYALLDDCSLALVVRSGKMVKICLNTMKVTLVYATPRKEVVTIVYDSKRDEMDQTTVILSKASAGRELVTRAESKGSVLVYDNVSGKRVAKLRPPADVTSYRIEYLKVNESGEVCITLAERRSTVLVFNVPKRQYLFKILLEDYMYNYQLMFMPMTENLIAVLRKKYSKKMQRGEDITATSVFKLKESPGELAKLYVDKDYKIKYLKKIPKWSPLPRSMEIVGHTFVDEDYYITMSRDGFMRVWDMNKDEIERIQVGEIEDLECEFESNIQYAGHGPFIVAYYGNTFKVWHKGSWKLLAIFTLDESICMMDWTILKDGKSILLVTCNDEIHHITLKNGGIDVDLAKEPELFIGEDSDNHLNIEDVEWAEDGPHESDSDSDDYNYYSSDDEE